jgi:DNA-directed RNA polymerase subunit RPC12/RpoP
MAKCDTATTPKAVLRDDGIREGWCRRCFKEFIETDDEQQGVRCQTCKVIHLKERTLEKLSGHLCRSCAEDYEAELLKKMTSSHEIPSVSG